MLIPYKMGQRPGGNSFRENQGGDTDPFKQETCSPTEVVALQGAVRPPGGQGFK